MMIVKGKVILMTDSPISSAKNSYRLALLRRRRKELHFGTTWRILVKIAAVSLLTALLIFAYASQKWWGAPFLIIAAAIAVYLPAACAFYSRAISKLERLPAFRTSKHAPAPNPSEIPPKANL